MYGSFPYTGSYFTHASSISILFMELFGSTSSTRAKLKVLKEIFRENTSIFFLSIVIKRSFVEYYLPLIVFYFSEIVEEF